MTKSRWKFDAFLIASAGVWGAILVRQLKIDGQSDYPYHDVIGRNLLPVAEQIQFGARSLLETFQKSFSAVSLTSVRLGDRTGLAAHWPFPLLVGVWLAPILAFAAFYRRVSAQAHWICIWLAGTYLYLLIPNTNIGSEHYGYFPSLAFWVLLISLLHTRINLLRATSVILALALFSGTVYRTGQLRSRLEFSMADVERYPESAIGWNNVAVAILESHHPDRVEMAKPFVEKAVELAPWFPNVQLTRFLYQFERGDKKQAGLALKEIEKIFKNDPVKVARYYRFFGMLQLQEKNL